MEPKITAASFQHAYRSYAVEQGNDTYRAQTKSAEIGAENEVTRLAMQAEATDALSISPEAARMYAEQAQRRRTVAGRRKAEQGDPTLSTTARPAQRIRSTNARGGHTDPGPA